MINGDNIKQVLRAVEYLEKSTDTTAGRLENIIIVLTAVLMSIHAEIMRLRDNVKSIDSSVAHIDRNI